MPQSVRPICDARGNQQVASDVTTLSTNQNLSPDHATVASCELEPGPQGQQLVASVQLGAERFRYRIDSARSWKPLGEGDISLDRQRLIDFALWRYLRDFTAEIDARLALRTSEPPGVAER
jgi:hypothetical protein